MFKIGDRVIYYSVLRNERLVGTVVKVFPKQAEILLDLTNWSAWLNIKMLHKIYEPNDILKELCSK